ncbi:MAG: DUF4623 domain-containing protein [Puniceicoccaceae bacterium]|nr:MAG: DUF4623 domain-containing protein [Puniceicoccaceae bacterium]
MKRRFALLPLLILPTALTLQGSFFLSDAVWTINPGDTTWFANDNAARGMTVNPVTGNVIVPSRTGGVSVNVVNGMTGAQIGTMNVTGISGGVFALNMMGAAADGSLYGINLGSGTAGTGVKVYRWADESAAPVLIFDGDLPGGRYGDNIAVRGSGNDVEILLVSGDTTNPNLVTIAPDGMGGWGSSVTATTGVGRMQLGTAFGSGSTMFGTAQGSNLHYVDLSTGTALEIFDSSVFSIGVSPIAVDPTNNLLAGLVTASGEIQLHDIATLSEFGTTLDTKVLSAGNANTNASGDMVFHNGMLYVLNTNNGIAAYEVIPEPSTYALIAGLLVLVGAVYFRRRRA